MTDIWRTLLWVVFSMSLFLIYDAWNKHNGQPSFFSPPATKPAVVGVVPAPPSGAGVPVPAAAGTPPVAVAAPAAQSAEAGLISEKVTITTDLVKATLDSKGGDLVRVEFLQQKDQFDHSKNMVLLDQSPERLYVAQTGLIPAAGGAGLPNHHTVMQLVPGARTLAAGQNDLKVVFESPVVGGTKLVKTYTFKRGDYVVDVKNEVVNQSGAAINPRLYLQLVRDGNAPAGESSFYFTFTGPAIYDDGAHFKKIDFKSIEKRKPDEKPDHETNAEIGRAHV